MIYVKQNGNVYRIYFKTYVDGSAFAQILNKIKSVPGRKYNSVGKENYWTIPADQIQKLKELFPDLVVESTIVSNAAPMAISTDISFLDELKLEPYPFQVLGISFLCQNRVALIGDEMGLGKSLQALAGIYKLHRQGKISSALIICPASLKFQWAEEIDKFLDLENLETKVVIVDGDLSDRIDAYEYIRDNGSLFTIINYEAARIDIELLLQLNFDIMICDEAHRLKDAKSKTYKAVKQLLVNIPNRWFLTGTPVQNRPLELFNLFTLLDKDIFGSYYSFRNKYIIVGNMYGRKNVPLGMQNQDKLHIHLAPYMLRRLKKDVAPQLPDLIVTNRFIPMTIEQTNLHSYIRQEFIDLIREVEKHNEYDEWGELVKRHPKSMALLGMLTMMEEVCDSPELLGMSDSKLAQKYYKAYKGRGISPKINEVCEILKEFLDSNPNGKAVIFTKYERMQRLLYDEISKIGRSICVNGTLKAEEKQNRIKEFRTNPQYRFLIATDSLNYGVNLQEANLLINVDLHWNPAVINQRNSRIHRINSEHDNINVINLISIGGIDEKVLDTIQAKQDMSDSIIENSDEELAIINAVTNDLISRVLGNSRRKFRK